MKKIFLTKDAPDVDGSIAFAPANLFKRIKLKLTKNIV